MEKQKDCRPVEKVYFLALRLHQFCAIFFIFAPLQQQKDVFIDCLSGFLPSSVFSKMVNLAGLSAGHLIYQTVVTHSYAQIVFVLLPGG